MSIQKNTPVPSLLVNTEPLIEAKNEPPEPEIVEIGIDDILDSSDEEIPSDIKDVDIVEHILCEDSIETKTVLKHILETKHSKSVETQIIVKTKNALTKNLTQSENLNKTEDASNGNVSRGTDPGVVEIQDSNEDFNALENLETDELVINVSDDSNDSIRSGKPEHPKKTDFAKSSKTSEPTSLKRDKEEIKVIKAPVVPVELHEYTSLSKDKYVCNYCQLACNKLVNVKEHIKRKHRKIITMYQCSNCPYQSKFRECVRNHIIQKHKDFRDNQWFKCHFCDKKFKLKYRLARHILVHQQRLVKCPICGKGFVTKSRVNVHVRFSHNKEPQKRLKCHECEYTSPMRKRLKYHIRKYHMKPENLLESDQEERYRCDKCDYKTYRLEFLKKHKFIHLKPEDIQYFHCYHCAYKSDKRVYFTAHISKHFKKEEVPFHCYICDFVTLRRNLIIEHIEKHAKFKLRKLPRETKTAIDDQHLKYPCNKCDYKTFMRQNLKDHKIIHLKAEGSQYLYCYHCPYKSQGRLNLRLHILRHFKNSNVPFNCYICDFMTLKRELIIEHIKKHAKLKLRELPHEIETEIDDSHLKYRCDECTYKTFKRAYFNSHKLRHLKPEEIHYFYCYHCSFKSRFKAALKTHIVSHFKNEEIKFYCYICDFMTLKRDLITEHIKKHSKVQSIHFKKGEIKFHCYMCDFMTLKRDVIAEHIKNHSKVLSKSEIQEGS